MVEIIGREEQLEKFKRWINQEKCSYLVSINGRGGAGKTYLLRKIHELYSKRNDLLCLDIIDFSQSKTRTKQWLMDSIASNANESSSMPMAFETYRNKSTEFDDRKPQEDAAYLSMEELEKSFKEDFQEVEKTRRCIFLFDTFELIQDSMLSDFIIELAQQSENSLFFLAGRRNAEMDGQLKKLLGNHYQFIKLEGFDEKDAIQYIRKNHAGKKLSEQEQKALYLLADNGLPIKLALALDWLSRGLMMHTLADYSANLKDMSEAEKQNIRLAFEQELVTLISELGTKVDQAIYLMAHVNRRFNRELLNLLIPDANIETLVDAIKQLSFVKCIEDNYFVLHDELQRMIVRHVWERNDQSHEARREISQKVIEYYTQQINQL
ncbi:MAG: hypothetical protein EHM85_20525, partial [Desulfobacteraceae bacterium]